MLGQQQRALSHAAASCSSRSPAAFGGQRGRGGSQRRHVTGSHQGSGGRRAAATAAAAAASALLPAGRRPRPAAVAAAGPAPPGAALPDDAADAYAAAVAEGALFGDPDTDGAEPFTRLAQPQNARPDFDDPDWAQHVDDWSEFWTTAPWEDKELEDLLAFDDEYDAMRAIQLGGGDAGALAEGAAEGPAGKQGGAAGAIARRLARAERLIEALGDVRKRASATRILGGVRTKETLFFNAYEMPPDSVTIEDPNPPHNAIYLRAMVEKQRRKEALDAEWRRRQAQIGCIPPMDYSNDIRLEHDHVVRENWSHEQIMELIEGNGMYARVEDVEPHAIIINPLRNADYHNDYGVEAIPETEDFMRANGLMLEEEDILRLDEEVELGEADFVDPGFAFQAEDGTIYAEAPVSEFRHLLRMRTAEDVASMLGPELALKPIETDDGGVVDAAVARARARAAAAAKAEAARAGASDEEAAEEWDDDWLPEP